MKQLIEDLQKEIQTIKEISAKGQDVPAEKLNYLLLASLMEEEEDVSQKIKFKS